MCIELFLIRHNTEHFALRHLSTASYCSTNVHACIGGVSLRSTGADTAGFVSVVSVRLNATEIAPYKRCSRPASFLKPSLRFGAGR